MSMLEIVIDKDYSDGMTKQSFKDSTDINKILKKAMVSGGISHAFKYDAAVYGEFTGVDLLGAYAQVERAREIFEELPSEVRSEFGQDAFKFAAFASDPINIDRLAELIPLIAEPGRHFINPNRRIETPPAAVAAEPGVTPAVPPVVPPVVPDVVPPPAPEAGVS